MTDKIGIDGKGKEMKTLTEEQIKKWRTPTQYQYKQFLLYEEWSALCDMALEYLKCREDAELERENAELRQRLDENTAKWSSLVDANQKLVVIANQRADTAEARTVEANKAARLVAEIFNEDRGDIDGGWLQDKAVECGVLIPVEATEPCIDPEQGNCACAEYGDFPLTCYRLNEGIRALLKGKDNAQG
jgi:hypothetical protein